MNAYQLSNDHASAIRRGSLLALIAAVVGSILYVPLIVSASQSDSVSNGSRADLAAMALDSTVMPPGHSLLYEAYVPGDIVADTLLGGAVSQEAVASTELQWFYESVYLSEDGSTRIRSYIEEYGDDLGAARGFGLLEDETVLAPSYAILEDEPVTEFGEEPSELTLGSMAPSAEPGDISVMDLTFRMDNLVAGVSINMPAATSDDRALLFELAGRLEERISQVLAGEMPESVDPDLARQMLFYGEGWAVTDEGYLAANELYGPSFDDTLSARYSSGYVRGVALGSLLVGGLLLPRVTIAMGEFDSDIAALDVFNTMDAYLPPLLDMQPAEEVPSVDRAAATIGYHYENPYLSEPMTDSYRVVALAGSTILTVDVQGNESLQQAEALAKLVAESQLSCLESGDNCEASIPEQLLTPSPITS